MIETKVSAVDDLNLHTVQEIFRSPGPCISFLLPPYRPGAQSEPMAAMLKTDLQEVARQLALRKIPDATTKELLGPLEKLTRDTEFLTGSRWGRAVYCSPGTLRVFELIGPINHGLTIGARFDIRPLLAELHLPAEFYLLKLSKKEIALLRCAHFKADPVHLPHGMPETLQDALEFKQPDHDLEDRTLAGTSAGMRVRFGTGSGRETQQTYLSDFYKAVDRGIGELLNGGKAPLVLAGVDEDIALYRMVNTHPNLLLRTVPSGVAGTMPLPDEELMEQAYWIIRSDAAEKAAARLTEWKERATPARVSMHLEEILNAATEGRVDRVYIDESARRVGVFSPANQRPHYNWGEEDLLNIAAIETILHSGLAFALPNSKMPDGAAIAAVFRY